MLKARDYTPAVKFGAKWLPKDFAGFVSGNALYVGPVTSPEADYNTIQDAVNAAVDGDTILVQPGIYAETVTIAKNNITVIGMGSHLSTKVGYIYGQTAVTAAAMNISGQNVELVNLDISGGTTTTYGVLVTGDGFSAIACKFEMQNDVGIALKFLGSAVSGVTGSLGVIDNCEFAWAEEGIRTVTATSNITQMMIKNSWFHNLSTSCIGGAGTASVKNLTVTDCQFDNMEDGTEPTEYLHFETGDTGIVTNCSFACATNVTTSNKVPATLFWVSNKTVAGISTQVPQ